MFLNEEGDVASPREMVDMLVSLTKRWEDDCQGWSEFVRLRAETEALAVAIVALMREQDDDNPHHS